MQVRYHLIFLCLLSISSAGAGQVDLVGKEFYRYLMNTGFTLTFHTASCFEYHVVMQSCLGGTATTYIIGTYEQTGNQVLFHPEYRCTTRYDGSISITRDSCEISDLSGSFETCSLDSSVLLLKTGEVFDPNAPAMWSVHNDFIYLIDNINQTGRFHLSRIWHTFKQKEEHLYAISGFTKNIPARWKPYLLREPVESRIIDSIHLAQSDYAGTFRDFKYLVTIDKGLKHGLQYGHRLFYQDASIRLIEVNDKSSLGILICSGHKPEGCLNPQNKYSTKMRRPG